MSEADKLKEAKEEFELSAERESENRTTALDDLRFLKLNQHWPEQIQRKRQIEGRPCLTIPKLPQFVRQVLNDARQNKPAIKVHPADSKADVQTAQIYDGLIRNIEVTSRADVAYDTALDFAVSGGFGYFRIVTKYAYDDSFDLDLAIERIANPFSVYGDPYSTEADSCDWNTAFVVDRMPRDMFARQYKGAEAMDWDATGYNKLQDPWVQANEILIAERWKRDKAMKAILLLSDQTVLAEDVYAQNKAALDALGIQVMGSRQIESYKITQQLMTGAEILEEKAWKGKYIPIVPVYGNEFNLEGKRYWRSMIHDAKDAQMAFDYWRTATAELVGHAPRAPWLGPKGAFITDQQKWETANTDSHAYIEYDGQVPPQRQVFAGVPAGSLQEALNASDDMKSIIGMYDASLGARSNETSGIAINARKREGDVSTFHYIDNLSRAIEHGGRILIDLIPHVYSGERMIRVLGGEDGKQASNVQLGRPVPVQGPNGQPQMNEQGLPLTRIFDLSVGKYDLTVETGPSYTTQREETAEQMFGLLKAFPAAAPVIGDLLAKNLDWPGADEIAKRLQMLQQSMLQGGGQGGKQSAPPDPVAMAKVQADAQQGQAELQLKQQQLQIDAFKAQTDRMSAEAKLLGEQTKARLASMPQSQFNS